MKFSREHVPRQPLEPFQIQGHTQKGQDHMSFFVFFCVYDTPATCGHYFSKA